MRKITRKQKNMKKQISDAIKLLSEKPEDVSILLKNFRFLRRYRVRDYRIIFCLPYECREYGVSDENGCKDLGDDVVLVRQIIPRKRDYRDVLSG